MHSKACTNRRTSLPVNKHGHLETQWDNCIGSTKAWYITADLVHLTICAEAEIDTFYDFVVLKLRVCE